MMKRHWQLKTSGFAFLLTIAFSTAAGAQHVGPASGSLVIAGGAVQDEAIYRRFIELAGGSDAPIVVIPTAGGAKHYDAAWKGLDLFRNLGVKNLTLLHTYDPRMADTDDFAAPLEEARGVWFSGGRQWRLADAYLDTKVHEALRALLDRGGVIGGSSAGATIQGSYLARGDTRRNTIMMGDHQQGLSLLKDVAIDQHLLKRNRQFDLIEIIEAHPQLLGLGLDEDTAIVVAGDSFEVIGQSYVAVYDHRRMLASSGRFYLLAPGDRFDLKTRTPSRRTRGPSPFDHVAPKIWPDPP